MHTITIRIIRILVSIQDRLGFPVNRSDFNTYCPVSDYKSHSAIYLVLTNDRMGYDGPYTVPKFSSDHFPIQTQITFDAAIMLKQGLKNIHRAN